LLAALASEKQEILLDQDIHASTYCQRNMDAAAKCEEFLGQIGQNVDIKDTAT